YSVWLRAWEVDRRLGAQKESNQALERRNLALGAEVRDLKQGYDAIEERARYELGFVKADEVFFQVVDVPKAGVAPAFPATSTAPPTVALPEKPAAKHAAKPSAKPGSKGD
ncbi:MAG: septum formation initiator family protein, partial [Betaproteobacteria bacterium]